MHIAKLQFCYENPKTLNSVASTFDRVLIYPKCPKIPSLQSRFLKQKEQVSDGQSCPNFVTSAEISGC